MSRAHGLTWQQRKKLCSSASCHNRPPPGMRFCGPCFAEMKAERERLFREAPTCNEGGR